MSERIFSVNVGSAKQLDDGIENILLVQIAVRKIREENPSAILYKQFSMSPIEDIGFTPGECNVLLACMGELAKNIAHGLGVDYRRGNQDEASQALNTAFKRAKSCTPDSNARFGIIFDSEVSEGRVFVTHPIVTGLTPPLNIEEAKRKRRDEGRGGLGGFNSIDSGILHAMMAEVGLLHSVVQSRDSFVDPKFPEKGYRRELYFTFIRGNQ